MSYDQESGAGAAEDTTTAVSSPGTPPEPGEAVAPIWTLTPVKGPSPTWTLTPVKGPSRRRTRSHGPRRWRRLPAGTTPAAEEPGRGGQSGSLSRRLDDREHQFLLALLALTLLLGSLYAVITPPFAGPDEIGHFDHVKLLWDTKGDRTSWDSVPPPPNSERHQPDSYYWLVSPGYALTAGQPVEIQLVAVRVVSLFLFLIEVVLAYRVARLLAPRSRSVPLITAAIVALLPGRLWIASMANNDNLAALASVGLLYFFLRIAYQGPRATSGLGFGLFVLLSFSSKGTALPVVVVLLAALVAVLAGRAVSRLLARRSELSPFALFLIVLIGMIVPALGLYSATHQGTVRAVVSGALDMATGGRLALLRRVWSNPSAIPPVDAGPFVHQLKSFWLPLLSDDRAAPDLVYWLASAVALVALSVLAASSLHPGSWRTGRALGWQLLILISLVAAVWSASLLLHLRLVIGSGSFNVPLDSFPPTHARYLFPALVPVAYLSAMGIEKMSWRRGRGAISLVVAGVLALEGVGFWELARRFHS